MVVVVAVGWKEGGTQKVEIPDDEIGGADEGLRGAEAAVAAVAVVVLMGGKEGGSDGWCRWKE